MHKREARYRWVFWGAVILAVLTGAWLMDLRAGGAGPVLPPALPMENQVEPPTIQGPEYVGDFEDEHAVSPEEVLRVRVAAEAGDARAEGALGLMYHEGGGVKRDLREALHWFRKGAEGGDTTSMLYLGRYYKGDFPELQLEPNYNESEKWLKRVVASGDESAMAELGALLYKRVRMGERERLEEASWWYNRATGGPWDPDYQPPALNAESESEAPPTDW